jgi:hypothetical protein
VPLLLVAALGVQACGGSAEEPAASPAEVVPRDAYLYVETVLRLGSETGRPARRFIARLTGERPVPEGAVIDALVKALDVDVGLARRLEPWVGERGAVFMRETADDPHAVGLVLEATDTGDAERFLRRELGPRARGVAYRGVRFWRAQDGRAGGVLRGRAVLASSAAVLRAMIAAQRAPLASAGRYGRARRGRPFLIALARPQARSALLSVTPSTAAERRAIEWVWPGDTALLLQLSLEGGEAVAHVHGLRAPAEAAPPIADIPGDAWFALSSGDLGTTYPPQVPALFDAMVRTRIPRSLLRALRAGTFFVQQQPDEPAGELRGTVPDPRAGRTRHACVRTAATTGAHSRGRAERLARPAPARCEYARARARRLPSRGAEG